MWDADGIMARKPWVQTFDTALKQALTVMTFEGFQAGTISMRCVQWG